MKKYILFCIAFLPVMAKAGARDSFSYRAQRYIEQYYNLAIAEQRRAGVPASVTLAQGVLETEAGKSELVCMANNHFGIKCKNDYQGEKFFHDDDAPKECFKMYRCAEDSYKDHSDYLKRNPRYNPLFSISQTDYASWAVGLKRCGYATNPQYAQRLIKIIEDFKLQEYTYSALDSPSLKILALLTLPETNDTSQKITPEPILAIDFADAPPPFNDTVKKIVTQDTAKPASGTSFSEIKEMAVKAKEVIAADNRTATVLLAANMPLETDSPKAPKTIKAGDKDANFDSGKIITVNGLKAFYAAKGEMLLQYAVKYNIRYPHLLEINDLIDAPLAANTLIYLEKKLNSGTHVKHTVKDDENIYLIAQQEGMSLKRLLALNMLEPNEEPAPGIILELQKGATRKPALRATPPPDLKSSTNLSYVKPTPKDDFIKIGHEKIDSTQYPPLRKGVTRDAYVTTIPLPADSTQVKNHPFADSGTTKIPTTSSKLLDSLLSTDDTEKDELAELKSRLDKVVYNNDNKNILPQAEEKHDSIKLTPITDKPVKPIKSIALGAKKGVYYIVKKGDNMSRIAQKNKVTVSDIVKINNVEPDELTPGQKIRVK